MSPNNTQNNLIPKNHRARWTANESNSLHNEYEMKELTVQEIATIHQRTVQSILNKLQQEGLIDTTWFDARGWTPSVISLKPAIQQDLDDSQEDDDDYEEKGEKDEDYVPEDDEEDDEDDDDEENHIFDPVAYAHEINKKMAMLQKQITSINNFLHKMYPKKNILQITK
jgi:hypothetical protein